MVGGEFYLFAAWIVMVVISVTMSEKMAKNRRRDVEGWLLLSAFIGPIALLLLRVLGDAGEVTAESRQKTARVSIGVSAALMLGLFLVLFIPLFRACFKV